MRRRREGWRRIVPVMLIGNCLIGLVRSASAQDAPLPAAIEDRYTKELDRPNEARKDADYTEPPMPQAPAPITGPASFGMPRGGTDVKAPSGLPLNLATALQLAGVNPLDIAAATAQVRQSLALYLQAKVLWVPNVNGGVDYFRHDGVQQNIFTGPNFRKGRQSFFVGGGPSLSVGLADAVFAPLAARRVVAARKADLQAARNDVLLTVSQAFFQLQEARGRLLGITAAVVRAEILTNFARELAPALIAPFEVNRAKTEQQSLRQAQQLAIRDWRVASARLAEVLLLDPATLLEPIEPPFLQVTLISCERSLDDLVAIALVNRPEITSRRELVAAANMFLKREKSRPFLPNLFVLSPATSTGLLPAGSYFAGPNNLMNSNGSRFDIEVAAVWELQNAGFGNVGLIRQRRAERDLAAIDLTRILFRVRSEITQADARLQTARIRVVETEEEVRQSVESADKNFIGLRQTTRPAGELLRLVVRPQEVVQAIEAMNQAYQQYAAAVSEYNAAQFDVYHALGQPAQFVTSQARDWMAPSDGASNGATAETAPAPTPPPSAVSLSADRPRQSR